jgi:glycosyltransferase involved in cell wall biosynthesis
MTVSEPENRNAAPDLSLIMPCYNEQENVRYTVTRLLKAFRASDYAIELIAVDNGSEDSTGELIDALAAEQPEVVACHVERNIGYGNGILVGIPLGRAEWVGFVAADGQVDAEDVVRLMDAAVSAPGEVLAKVRRRFRMDGPVRWVISVVYNLFVWCLWPKLGSLDINGTPRILRRDLLLRAEIESKNWLFDPELLIKAHYMGARVLEVNVFSRMRGGGSSHVRAGTLWEFFSHLLLFRFSRRLDRWKRVGQE